MDTRQEDERRGNNGEQSGDSPRDKNASGKRSGIGGRGDARHSEGNCKETDEESGAFQPGVGKCYNRGSSAKREETEYKIDSDVGDRKECERECRPV